MERPPVLIVNYKTYNTGIGRQGLEIAKGAEHISRDYNVEIMLAVPYTMIPVLSGSVSIPILAQHVDPLEPGRGTGFVTVEAIRDAGAKGSLINHSEHRVTLADAQIAIKRLKESGLLSVGCGDTPEAAGSIGLLGADIIAVEPPELIGTGISVSKAKPEVVTAAIALIKERLQLNVPVLVGAGITHKDDARRSIELGADGILVASAVMKAEDPVGKIKELAEGLIGKA
uniref:Triosephosphate isomerase n=1 Tax=Fervidicoccus fontis TaxID=683846 RepID=A0A7J3ZLR5_9CREN